MKGYQYAHMCRDGHEQIGHNDSEHEPCPWCRDRAALLALLRQAVGCMERAYMRMDNNDCEEELLANIAACRAKLEEEA